MIGNAQNKILAKLLERLFASLVNGPSLNARPHASRQRVDLAHIGRLGDFSAEDVLGGLLDTSCGAKIRAKVSPPRRAIDDGTPEEELSDSDRQARRKWTDQQAMLHKLRIIAEDAKTYEQDTGVHVLHVGFPLLSLPPGSFSGARSGGFATRRVLAPIAFVPVSVTVKRGTTAGVELACKGEGTDRVVPNIALLAWLEQQTGKAARELFADDGGIEPWREVCEIVTHVCATVELPVPELFKVPPPPPPAPVAATPASPPPDAVETNDGDAGVATTENALPPLAANIPDDFTLRAAPRAEDTPPEATILHAAVLGLFPMTNQGLLRDMQAMASGEEPLAGPLESFIHAGVDLDAPAAPAAETAGALDGTRQPRVFTDERLVTAADPCQSRAVKLARQSRGLVVHGPPGTGKSQTITNVIGDHLSRGERVLLVCDKRTALDVVANRLEHMGLGKLCALIHDPQRDQRELYRTVREQLDELPEARTDSRAERKLAKLDEDLQSLHTELTLVHEALMTRDAATGLSFHELVGEWLALTTAAQAGAGSEPNAPVALDVAEAPDAIDATLAQLDQYAQDVTDALAHARRAELPSNPWTACVGIALSDFLARPMDEFRRATARCAHAEAAAAAAAHENIPPFAESVDMTAQAEARPELAELVQRLVESADQGVMARWSGADAETVRGARGRLADAEPFVRTLHGGALDAELAAAVRGTPVDDAQIARDLGDIEAFLAVAPRWYAIFAFGTKSRASRVLRRYGLPPGAESAGRLRTFLLALRARRALQTLVDALIGDAGRAGAAVDLLADDVLNSSLGQHRSVLDFLIDIESNPMWRLLSKQVAMVMKQPNRAPAFIDGLHRSPARAAAIVQLEQSLASSRLFSQPFLAASASSLRAGKGAAGDIAELARWVDTLESVLRAAAALSHLPPSLRGAADDLVARSIPPEAGLAALRRTVLGAEISRRLRADEKLQGIDGQRMSSSFERYRSLEEQKKSLVRDVVMHRWVTRQKERLLASTGSRLNSAGADLRRRLTIRGQRAMRLRQVIQVGQGIEGGDPLFDLCPVWMASPETVAQLFPRRPLFDVVIFDEASQCRLEEALPVLVRGQRVVIAGDPRQLPPTRFFESAVAQSEEEEPQTDQDLFEQQQAEIEDLLGAALNLSIQQCYLDVHYRSRNADLIAFSNEHFYGKRLQAIPGHPSNRSRFAPLTLYRADGTYAEGCNEKEAEHVCRIVQDLLKRADPPSIGIACFNVDQRDLIVEKLDELSATDNEFARRLAEARGRKGEGSSEGLFVKNLENVQGDERDHIVISTTYGPDEKGRFYRRFGPLGRAGGGRRLNVLVTRAREEVHIVTSIPPEAYRALPPMPAGQTPSGAWLLFAYLNYAEMLAAAYEQAHRTLDAANAPPSPEEAPLAASRIDGPSSATPKAEAMRDARAHVRPTEYPSPLATALGEHLATHHRVGSDVHWGNDGFCVDVALHHPDRAEDVTVGVLCDATRFEQAQDPVEWDVFRTAIHEGQGWRLHRVWSPSLFRDVDGNVRAVLRGAAELMAAESPKDSIRTSS